MSEYGKGYILKSALLDAVEWDSDIEKWVIWDDDLQSLMAQKNDVVEVVRCKDCVHKVIDNFGLVCSNGCTGEYGEYVGDNHFCSDGERRGGE